MPQCPNFLKNVVSWTGHKVSYEDEPSVCQRLSPLIFRTLCFSSRSWELLVFLADVSVHCWLMLGLWSVKIPNDILKERLLLFPPLGYEREGLWKNIERLKKKINRSLTCLSFILPSYPFLCVYTFLKQNSDYIFHVIMCSSQSCFIMRLCDIILLFSC